MDKLIKGNKTIFAVTVTEENNKVSGVFCSCGVFGIDSLGTELEGERERGGIVKGETNDAVNSNQGTVLLFTPKFLLLLLPHKAKKENPLGVTFLPIPPPLLYYEPIKCPPSVCHFMAEEWEDNKIGNPSQSTRRELRQRMKDESPASCKIEELLLTLGDTGIGRSL